MPIKTELSALYWKNWKFWYKLIAGLFTIGVFLAVFISGMIDVKNLGQEILKWFNNDVPRSTSLDDFMKLFQYKFAWYFRVDWISVVPVIDNNEMVIDLSISAGYGEYAFFFNSFFTNISNLLVGIWFLTAALAPKKEGRGYYIGFSGTLIVTTYIALTMIVFTSMLVPVAFIGGIKLTWELVIVMVFQHLIFPLLLIIYVCLFFNPRATMKNQKYMWHEWWKIAFWLLLYLAFTLIRGEIRYKGRRPTATLYPYFFMDIHNPNVMGLPGRVWLIIVTLFIIGLVFGISILLNLIVTKRVRRQRKNKKW